MAVVKRTMDEVLDDAVLFSDAAGTMDLEDRPSDQFWIDLFACPKEEIEDYKQNRMFSLLEEFIPLEGIESMSPDDQNEVFTEAIIDHHMADKYPDSFEPDYEDEEDFEDYDFDEDPDDFD